MSRVRVRCPDRMVFPVDEETLEPLRCGSYDAYCYSDPEPGVEYIEHAEWCLRVAAIRALARSKG